MGWFKSVFKIGKGVVKFGKGVADKIKENKQNRKAARELREIKSKGGVPSGKGTGIMDKVTNFFKTKPLPAFGGVAALLFVAWKMFGDDGGKSYRKRR